jgi:hypothetical protein
LKSVNGEAERVKLTQILACEGTDCRRSEEVKMSNRGGWSEPKPPVDWLHLNQRNQRPLENSNGDYFFCSWDCVITWAQSRRNETARERPGGG